MLRDAHFTGVSYGSFDLDWLLRSLRFGVDESGAPPPLAIDGAKGLPAIESFILARLFMFQQVYFHKASRASEWLLSKIFERVRFLIVDGTAVENLPTAVENLARNGDAKLMDYLALNDSVIWMAITAWQSSRDRVLADLSTRLCRRRLFKTYELFGEAASTSARHTALEKAREIAVDEGLDPDVYVGLDSASDWPYEERDGSFRVIFPQGELRLPGDVSYLLGRLRGQRLERVRLIFAPALRDRIHQALTP